MPSGNEAADELDSRLGRLRLIEELDHQGQSEIEPQHVVRVNLAVSAKAGDPSEDRDPPHGVPVVQNRKDLIHKGFTPSMIPFAEIDPNHQNVGGRALLRAHRLRAR